MGIFEIVGSALVAIILIYSVIRIIKNLFDPSLAEYPLESELKNE